MTVRLRLLLLGAATTAAVLAAPPMAAACATCVTSAYGDRTFNWAYLGLLLMPFAVVVVVGGVLAWSAGYRPRQAQEIVSGLSRRWRRRRPASRLRTPIIEEKT